MWSRVLILSFFLQSMLHLGVSFQFSSRRSDIETIYVKGKNKNEDKPIDWGCNLPKDTKISICKEILGSFFFSEVLQLDYNDSYEKDGHKFECETKELWLISKEYVRNKGFRGSQEMIMCPACVRTSKKCFNFDSSQNVNRHGVVRENLDDDRSIDIKQLLDAMANLESGQSYFDANEKFNSSQFSQYTDVAERFYSSKESASMERFDSEQKFGPEEQVLAKKTSIVEENIDTKQPVHADRPSDVTLFDPLLNIETEQQIVAKIPPTLERNTNTEPLVPFGQPSDALERLHYEQKVESKQQVVAEKTVDVGYDFNIKPLVHASKSSDVGKLLDILQKAYTEQETVAEKTPIVEGKIDNEQLVHAGQPNDAGKQFDFLQKADPEEQTVAQNTPVVEGNINIEQLVHIGQLNEVTHFDSSQNVEEQIVADNSPIVEENTNIEQLVHSDQPSDAVKQLDTLDKVEPKQQAVAEKSPVVEGNIDTEQLVHANQHSNTVNQFDFEEKVNPQENENPQGRVEEYYFSKAPGDAESILLYTWFEKGGYFTIYMHIINLKTSLNIQKKVQKPFNVWGNLNAQPQFSIYEPPEWYLADTKNNNAELQIPKSSPDRKNNKVLKLESFV